MINYAQNYKKYGVRPRSTEDYYEKDLDKAKSLCSDKNGTKFSKWHATQDDVDNPELAVSYLGSALHAKQDIYAHGNFDVTFSVHNSHSPQPDLLSYNSDVSDYPDDTGLDSDGRDGVPTDIKYVKSLGIPYGYAMFHKGENKRINATQGATMAALRDFQSHLKQQKKCCKCLEYFGVNKKP